MWKYLVGYLCYLLLVVFLVNFNGIINWVSHEKHAYLIIAHDNWKILEKLLILLDDKRNDIYLHIDRKSNLINFSNNVHNANLLFS